MRRQRWLLQRHREGVGCTGSGSGCRGAQRCTGAEEAEAEGEAEAEAEAEAEGDAEVKAKAEPKADAEVDAEVDAEAEAELHRAAPKGSRSR